MVSEKGIVNEDLIKERQKCTFNTLELTHLLDGGEAKTLERKEREEYFLSDPAFKDEVPMEYLSHKEQYEHAVRKACHMFRKLQEMPHGSMDNFREPPAESVAQRIKQLLGGMLGSAILKDGNPLALHYVMFLPTLAGQGTVEQQAYWISRAWNLEIVGTYAQTELGHGTFIRGLETTATYDPTTQEFVLNSPTLTAYKWWPGGLGHTANYAVVVAQLYTQGKCHGIHPFIVQLRDEETHMPMPGIIVGEIGAKLGMNTTNNGYLGFKEVRIPRENMLMKNNKVLEDGTYVKSPSDKLTYGTMMFVRVVICQDMASYLSKAVTIATRYSAVRHQSEMKPGAPEPQVLDYRTQQYKLIPAIASVFAMKFSANWIWEMYNVVNSELDQGDLERLPELHAMSCCLKALCTSDAATAVEIVRLACGGHGYMKSSNLPSTYGLVTAACTYEGENTVLLLQTARYLMKTWQQARSGQTLTPSVAYLNLYSDWRQPRTVWENTADCVVKAFYQVAAGKVKAAAEHMERRAKGGMTPEDAWNETSIELVAASTAHCRAFIVEKFIEAVAKTSVSRPLQAVLCQMAELYAVYWLLNNKGDFLMFSNLSPADVDGLQLWLEQLLTKLRPNAVGIVDSFDIHDDILGSPLGAWDGRVYERLFEESQKSPLNKEPVNKSFHEYMKPFLRSNL
ncbi:putative peroxisomal acyl-coenzyme A oxidase 1 [Frankliniella fusca]|uniref:Acyl-coenzyme A oxidase n=1 Tax=Frankliniella fusca TaxID=407009 RepID=A0AAE1LW09_9NEOP|nr:putative peroxisomal acyl-coenzyme A oxidase 1 [Frankliniella fusca]